MSIFSPVPKTVRFRKYRGKRLVSGMMAAAVMMLCVPSAYAAVLPVCAAADRAGRAPTCIYDGDTGWQDGVKWRLKDIDAPEIGRKTADCRTEQRKGIHARDRLRKMMARGYTIVNTGRDDSAGFALVHIRLEDGRDVGLQMLSEDLVQASPNTGNVWCGR
jgi:endonuclease YncB( thermonuclease family)